MTHQPTIRHTAVALALIAATTAVIAQPKAQNGLLTNEAGITLYVFDNDIPHSGKSVCTAGCAINWHAMPVKPGAKPSGDFSIITRDDGQQQWAYKGRPLYRFENDKKPGDQIGDGMRTTWHVAKP